MKVVVVAELLSPKRTGNGQSSESESFVRHDVITRFNNNKQQQQQQQ
jgi:hypothetical protein